MDLARASMLVALGLMFGAVGMRILAMHRLHRMKTTIAAARADHREMVGRLKQAQAQRTVTEQTRLRLHNKRRRVARRVKQLRQELADMVDAHEQRVEAKQAARAHLVR